MNSEAAGKKALGDGGMLEVSLWEAFSNVWD